MRRPIHAFALIAGLTMLAGMTASAQDAADVDQPEAAAAAFAWPVVDDPNIDPVVAAINRRLDGRAGDLKFHPDDVAAVAGFYKTTDGTAVWVDENGLTARANSARAEVERADNWGLEREAYPLPAPPAPAATAEQKADVEIAYALTVLKFARHARQGRVRPSSVTRINDFPGLTKDDAAAMWRDIALKDDVGDYLRGLHPTHPEFERLRQALLKARGISDLETGALPAAKQNQRPSSEREAKVSIPDGSDLTPGMQHKDIVVLRERLGVDADIGANSHYFDAPLAKALKDFQAEAGLVPTGNLDAATRKRLNAAMLEADAESTETAAGDAPARSKKRSSREIQLILNNMERWRWLPDDLGAFYVWNNVPEYRARVYKGDKTVFSEKIVVGLPEWATPSFMADMKFVIFHPSWGVPPGIKRKELLPRLQRAQPQSIFDFFGGSSGSSAVLRAYNLKVYRNGQQVNPDGITWNSSNIHSYSFIQPPGGKNPLGIVKFRFPNKHNVYMHDTIEPELFAKSRRAYSHGCIRVQNPVRLAQVLLAHDKGYSSDAVRKMARSGRSVSLDEEVPVYVTYMTARVDENGKLRTFGDVYGRDGRLARQLGRPMRFEQPKVASPDNGRPANRTARKKKKKNTATVRKRSRVQSTVRQAITGQYN